MSFLLSSFVPGRGVFNTAAKSSSPAIHYYGTTADNMAAVLTAGYFDDLLVEQNVYISVGDTIYVAATDQAAFVEITSLSPTITTAINTDIPAGSIGTLQLADLAVTTGKIANLAVTGGGVNGKIGADTITDYNIAGVSVSGDKVLIDDSVTNRTIAPNAITATEIQAGAVGNSQIANMSVDVNKITDGAVTTIKIGDAQVTNAKLAANAVTASKVAFAGEITSLGSGTETETYTVGMGAVLPTSTVLALIKDFGAAPVNVIRAEAGTAQITLTYSGLPSTDHVVNVFVINA